jgi:dihydrofolate synthase/folylpolyglutamate synthase
VSDAFVDPENAPMAGNQQDSFLTWLYGLNGPSLKWDIETARAFTEQLGHPHRAYPSVHLAGTNGKGSVAAMLHAGLREAGLRAGLYTSPHLIRPEERIRLDDQDIEPGAFRVLAQHLAAEAEEGLSAGRLPRHPSFFEIMTAAAMIAFRDHPVDVAVFETGLGGRLDATNVIYPSLSVITTIGLDHTKTLGPDLGSIAREKGGVIKPGIPVLVGWIGGEARAELSEIAAQVGAPLYLADREVHISRAADGTCEVRTPEQTYRDVRPALAGEHQLRNAALAIRASELLRSRGVPVAPVEAARGVANARWPGRLERFPGSPSFLLDAAHNGDGFAALAAHLDGSPIAPEDRVLVLGLTAGRKAATMIEPLRPRVGRIVIAEPRTSKAVPAEEVLEQLHQGGVDARLGGSAEEAIALACALAPVHGEVVVTGSLYLVGDARAVLLGMEAPAHRGTSDWVPTQTPPDPPRRP